MGKPDDIPQDVWDAAVSVCAAIYREVSDAPETHIARAILAEREACAQNADAMAEKYLEGRFRGDWAMAAHQIAAEIRARSNA